MNVYTAPVGLCLFKHANKTIKTQFEGSILICQQHKGEIYIYMIFFNRKHFSFLYIPKEINPSDLRFGIKNGMSDD